MSRIYAPPVPSPLSIPRRSPTSSETPSPSSSSPSTSPRSHTVRLPRVRSRPLIKSRSSLDSILEEAQGALEAADAPINLGVELYSPSPISPASPASLERPRNQRHRSGAVGRAWNGKSGITVDPGMRNVCGICFEAPVKPNKTRCCGQLFCNQHLSDWLGARASDGRCPTCRVPLDLEMDTIALHTPAKILLPRSEQRPSPARRLTASSLPRALRPSLSVFTPHHRRLSSSSSSSSSPELLATTSESSSDGESSASTSSEKRSRRIVVRPQYASTEELVFALVPLREFGAMLSLLGGALVVGILLS